MKHVLYTISLALSALLICGAAAQAEDAATGKITPGKILKITPVTYSELDRRFSHEGSVVVRLELDDTGKALSAAVAEPSDWQGLDDAAVKTALEWEYSPGTTASGQPVASSKLVAVTFKLEDRPVERARLEGDLPAKIGYVLGSYYTYRKAADEYLDVCGKRGFDTAKYQALLREGNSAIEPRIAQLERYLDEHDIFLLRRVQARYRDGSAYADLVRMNELRNGPVEKATERCTRVMANFEAGQETLQHFDPYAHKLLGEIQLEAQVAQ